MKTIVFCGDEYRCYNHLFAVSRDGKILRNFHPIEPKDNRRDKYLTVGRNHLVHRMVASCWVENLSNGNHVHHKDKDKQNNHADNLEWITPKQHFSDRHSDTIGKQSCPDSAKQKLRKLRLGKKQTEKTKNMISSAAKKMWSNPEKRAKILESHKHRKYPPHILDNARKSRQRPCEINGKYYGTIKEAAESLGVTIGWLRKRLFSKNETAYLLLQKLA